MWLLTYPHISLIRARDRRYPQVARRREEVRDDRRQQEDGTRDKTGKAGDNFQPSLTVVSLSVRSLSHDEQDLWYATDDKAEHEATIGLREVTKSHKSRKFKKFLVVVNV